MYIVVSLLEAIMSSSNREVQIHAFFANSELLDYLVLRPLSHIAPSWELTWDNSTSCYRPEDNSFAQLLNVLIIKLGATAPPPSYHDYEDKLAMYVQATKNWGIQKHGRFWVGAEYDAILEQGGFNDEDGRNLIISASGRIQGAINRGQFHFDDMEQAHRRMLAAILTIILYHGRSDYFENHSDKS